MLMYSLRQIADIFGISHSRLDQLHKKGFGPKRTHTETLHGHKGAPRITTEDALDWAQARIERLASKADTIDDAEKYLMGIRRLSAEAYVSKVRTYEPKPARPLTRVLARPPVDLADLHTPEDKARAYSSLMGTGGRSRRSA
jgi:hypothetical protein